MSGPRQIITQGEHFVSSNPELSIYTLLGSCVACCLWDPLSKIGGMNHILLTRSGNNSGQFNLIGVNAMELLITDLMKAGAMRGQLRAKVFGGARMIGGLSKIGSEKRIKKLVNSIRTELSASII